MPLPHITPEHLIEELEETETALADFHARIPDAVRELMRVYITTTNRSLRRRLRGRIAALLSYVEEDQDAGKPPPRTDTTSRWARTLLVGLQNTMPAILAVLNDPSVQAALHPKSAWADLPVGPPDDEDDPSPDPSIFDEPIDAEFGAEDPKAPPEDAPTDEPPKKRRRSKKPVRH